MKRYPLTQAWTEAISGWETALRAAGRSPATIETRSEHLRRFSRHIKAPGPGLVTRRRLIEWTGGQDWQPETRRGFYASLRGFYGFCLETGLVTENITDALPEVKPGVPRPRPMPDRQYRAALVEADPRAHIILRLAGEAGLRRGEIARINRRDLMEDLDGLSLLVHGKGNKERYIPLTDSLARELVDYLGHRDWLLPSPHGGHLTPRHVGKIARRFMPDIWTLHTLRHRFGTQVHRQTRDVLTVQQLLGHASLATTQRYIAVDTSTLRAAANAVAV